MTPTEKLLSHLQNILPRRDWELQRDAIKEMVAGIWAEGFQDAKTMTKPTEAKS